MKKPVLKSDLQRVRQGISQCGAQTVRRVALFCILPGYSASGELTALFCGAREFENLGYGYVEV